MINSILFSLPYIKDLIPVGVVFKALGVFTEKEIYEIINLKHSKMKKYISLCYEKAICMKKVVGKIYFTK